MNHNKTKYNNETTLPVVPIKVENYASNDFSTWPCLRLKSKILVVDKSSDKFSEFAELFYITQSNEDKKEREEPKRFRPIPLFELRSGSICVSDILHMLWCEQQLVFKLLKGETKESKAARRGRQIHSNRDHDSNCYQTLRTDGNEDVYSILMLNLINTLYLLRYKKNPCHREVPVFGMLGDLLVMGRIDEIAVDNDGSLDIVELKTTKKKRLPTYEIRTKNRLQVNLYRELFNQIVSGMVPRQALQNSCGLDLNRGLSLDIHDHIENNLFFLDGVGTSAVWTLNKLLDNIVEFSSEVPRIRRCIVDYVWQRTSEIFWVDEVNMDISMVNETIRMNVDFWFGVRDPKGVDIEDAFKCSTCEFRGECTLRRRRRWPPKISYENEDQEVSL